MSVKWYGDEENVRIDREVRKRLYRSAIVVNRRAKRLLSVAGTGTWNNSKDRPGDMAARLIASKGQRSTDDLHWSTIRDLVSAGHIVRHRGGNRKRIYGAFPSKPGDPPHKQTGRLRAGVTYEVLDGQLVARVGTNIKYAKWLELGTKHMLPRPWLRRALNESGSEIDRIWGG